MYNNKVVKLFVKETKNIQEKIQGLIGKDKPYALMIRTRFGIHTFGLKFPIDVLILNNENKVVSIKKNLKTNRIFLWNPMYDRVIELPRGTIEKKGIRIKSEVHLLL